MANYLELDTGRIKEKAGTVSANTAGAIVALDGTGKIDNNLMPSGIGADTVDISTSESLAAGAIINIWDNTGETVRNSDATSEGKEGMGFVLAGFTHPTTATVYFSGIITGLSGRTPGARQYIDSTTPGGLVETAPSTSGNVVQSVGRAITATTMSFEPKDPITVA